MAGLAAGEYRRRGDEERDLLATCEDAAGIPQPTSSSPLCGAAFSARGVSEAASPMEDAQQPPPPPAPVVEGCSNSKSERSEYGWGVSGAHKRTRFFREAPRPLSRKSAATKIRQRMGEPLVEGERPISADRKPSLPPFVFENPWRVLEEHLAIEERSAICGPPSPRAVAAVRREEERQQNLRAILLRRSHSSECFVSQEGEKEVQLQFEVKTSGDEERPSLPPPKTPGAFCLPPPSTEESKSVLALDEETLLRSVQRDRLKTVGIGV